ncbi:ras-associated and pleckstrin homology domains-containing protein 1-like [Palaemon carinicauda]|uniref:ras-associated and pleckstrin homology domains-containing protein 1-like n=1 Tax=Palaemon carinicauda TaxID=392227 RepID=UPI0035B59F69
MDNCNTKDGKMPKIFQERRMNPKLLQFYVIVILNRLYFPPAYTAVAPQQPPKPQGAPLFRPLHRSSTDPDPVTPTPATALTPTPVTNPTPIPSQIPPPSPSVSTLVSQAESFPFEKLIPLILQLVWSSLGLPGPPSKDSLLQLILRGANVQPSLSTSEVDALALFDIVVSEVSSVAAADAPAPPDSPAVSADLVSPVPDNLSRGKPSPTSVSPVSVSLPQGSSLIETALQRTSAAHGQLADPTAPRGHLRRRARPPLCLRGHPSPLVKRRLLVSSALSSQPSPAEELPLRSSPAPQTVPLPGPPFTTMLLLVLRLQSCALL